MAEEIVANNEASSSTSSANLVKFTLFPNLPRELRDQIWASAIPDPQTVKVLDDPKKQRKFKPNRPVKKWKWALKASYTVPNLLHVNSEARAVATKVYRPLLQLQLGRAPLYFDYERDTLFLEDTAFKRLNIGFRTNYDLCEFDDIFRGGVVQEPLAPIAVRNLELGGENSYYAILYMVFETYPKLENLTAHTNLPPFSVQGERDYVETSARWYLQQAWAPVDRIRTPPLSYASWKKSLPKMPKIHIIRADPSV